MSTNLIEDISDSNELSPANRAPVLESWHYPVPDELTGLMKAHNPSREEVPCAFFRRKYVLERVVGSALLVPGSLLIVVGWVLVKLTSRGPGFYRQTRVGIGGKKFQLIKLRTMRVDAEASGVAWSSGKDDPRKTRIGNFLRKLHLDELPQLWNVACGHMSLVGPRPERPEITIFLEQLIPGYHLRHNVKPGVTGLSQVNIEPDTNVNITRRKQILDLRYIGRANHILDLRIMAATLLRMFGLKGQKVMEMMHLTERIEIEDLEKVDYEFEVKESQLWSPGKPLPPSQNIKPR
ncbi:MAG: sugar transferase [Planctomycetota bacterium]|nr:sugar transferase [Planctomycetota bacterium]